MEKPDRERRERRPRPVLVLVARVLCVTVEVSVPKTACVLVLVHVKETPSPLPDESERKCDDGEADRRFDRPLDGLGQDCPDEHERQAESDQRRRVTETPREAEQSARASAAPVSPGHEDRHGGEVIRVGGVAEPEEQGDEKNKGGPPAIRQLRNRSIH